MDFRRKIVALLLMFVVTPFMFAQRFTDNLDRGLVAVVPRNGSGILLSWRIQVDEYYDVTYNVYRNGTKLNAEPLTASNYMDSSGNTGYTYTVRAIVDGVEQADSKPAKVFGTEPHTKRGEAGAPAYLSIPMKDVYDRNGQLIYSADGTVCLWNYSLNDASLADLDGDGEIEIIIKRINETDATNAYPDETAKELYETANTTAYTIIEAYKLDGTRLWWIDCGPNMVSLNSTEINCVAYDWDEDGKAEVVMRGADNMIIHMADGSTYDVGDMSVNTRNDLSSHTAAQYAWTHTGAEYLLYLDGETAAPYQIIEYPLKRFEDNEVGMAEWQVWCPSNSGGGYGHRSSKYFFGAPFLDGRKASIFLARGIYTQTKMVALDVDPATHMLTQRWYWKNNTSGSPWYGQGNHNFSVADVDGDGCDEIIYGSMAIDNNGKGLSTTGLGHGDALHVGDLDPYRKGLEVFACNEDNPGNNYRDGTTSEILYRTVAGSDDGRAMMANVSNEYPGSLGRSVSSGVISATAKTTIDGYAAENFLEYAQLNGRIYWDDDLLEEFMCSTSGNANQPGVVAKVGYSRIMQTNGATTINDSKKNHCAQGDIIGDWREEIVMRAADNKSLRVYSTDVYTKWRQPSLWYDHEYRQAMVWQVCAYNQPPHTSFFLGELEDITRAPLPLTNRNRTELAKSSTISSSHNGTTVMLCEAGNYGIDANGASPSLLVVNVPSTVSGNDNNSNIAYSYSQTQLGATINNVTQKGDLSGAMRLVKQGDGLLKLTARTFSYTGDTEIWGGTFYFRGTFSNSNVWMNRHTSFFCGATIEQSLTMEYGATLYPSKDKVSASDVEYATAKIGTLTMHEGSRIVFQMSDTESDAVELGTLNVRKQTWQYGPEYLAPVFEVQSTSALADGKYKLGTLQTVGSGELSSIIVECNKQNANSPAQIVKESNDLYLVIGDYTPLGATEVTWVESYKLDFEEESSNNYGFYLSSGAVEKMQQETHSDNTTHYFHVYQGVNNDRTVNIDFTQQPSGDYKFDFDLAIIGGSDNDHSSTLQIIGSNGTLFKIEYGAWATSATVNDGNGNFVATIDIQSYIKDQTNTIDYKPSVFNHFTLTGDAQGVRLSISRNGNYVIEDKVISDTYATVNKFSFTMGRNHSHLALDDIILKEKLYSGTLSDQIEPVLDAPLTYNTLYIERTLANGYNTLCVPFNTTVDAVAGAGTGARAYELESVNVGDDKTSLHFTEVTDIKANVPYLIYIDEEKRIVPDFTDIAIVEPTSTTVSAEGWSFISNYTPKLHVPAGSYLLSGNKLRRCGSSSYLNGMRGYFVKNSAAAASNIEIVFDDNATSIITLDTQSDEDEKIFNVSGLQQHTLGEGVNIIKMKDGTVKKIYVK